MEPERPPGIWIMLWLRLQLGCHKLDHSGHSLIPGDYSCVKEFLYFHKRPSLWTLGLQHIQ